MLVDAVGVAPDVRLPVRGLKSVRALDCDPVDLVAYWIENQSNTIRCARAVHRRSLNSLRLAGSCPEQQTT